MEIQSHGRWPMDRSARNRNQLPTNLPQLQNLIKRDPLAYRDEVDGDCIAPTLVGASPPSAVVALLHHRRLVTCSSFILGEVLGSSHLSGSTCFKTIPYCTVTTVKTQR